MKKLILLAVLLPTAASAHVVFDQPAAKAGGYYAGFLRVTHGCGASPTRSVRVEIPAGVLSARPQPKPGWTIAFERAKLATPVAAEGGGTITDRVTAITWTGELSPDEFDQFGLALKLPATPGALYFPVHQRCASGANEWVNVPATADAWGKTDHPAPFLTLSGADDMAHMHH